MINYIELPDLMPNNIRELFKDFDYKLPFYSCSRGYEENNNSIIEKEIYNNLEEKIYNITGFSPAYFEKLIKTQIDVFLKEIDLRFIASQNQNKLPCNILYEELNSIMIEFNLKYDYIYITHNVNLNSNEYYCESFDNCCDFKFNIIGSRRETEPEYLERILPIYHSSVNTLKKIEERKEKEKEKENKKNSGLEDIKLFSKNYEKYSQDIDNLVGRIRSNDLPYSDLDNFGNIGKWAKIKLINGV